MLWRTCYLPNLYDRVLPLRHLRAAEATNLKNHFSTFQPQYLIPRFRCSYNLPSRSKPPPHHTHSSWAAAPPAFQLQRCKSTAAITD
ncbi:hypothetical protein IF2G_04640 [Cordyceps javanica]|nr:hypothetical protein IF2G_04640 [Cordyceps javanica]